ncbi:MAG: methyltransferase domain-containing protein [Planctomycetota bacterium]|nr:methyltransferase domain-containing protein [Planctomycetota bacterium]
MSGSGASPTILDVRSEAAFAAGHAHGAVNIPADELAARAHELPPKGTAIDVFDDDPDVLAIAAYVLRNRGYIVREVSLYPAELRESGPSRARLWQPSPFLVEAVECIRPRVGTALFGGRALDLACGSGRDAAYLALAGYEVEAIDVLPDALERARDLARRSGVAVKTIEQDLKASPVLPAERYDLVAVIRFLHRPLLAAIREAIVPGGFVVYEAFHRRDAEDERRALKPSHTLEDGELAAAFEGFELLIVRDGLARGGRVFSQLLARRRV